MYTVHCTLYTVYTVHCTLHRLQCKSSPSLSAITERRSLLRLLCRISDTPTLRYRDTPPSGTWTRPLLIARVRDQTFSPYTVEF